MPKERCIILDFDGTIACYFHREHLRDVNFQEYINQSYNDKPNKPVIEIMSRFYGYSKIIILSARPESAREETLEWLSRHNLQYDELILKNNNDLRDDGVIKKDILENSLIPKYDILFCIDDRSTCVDNMRDLGLKVFQCGRGY